MNDLTTLLDLYCSPPMGYVGPRAYSGEGYRILDSRKESVHDIATEVSNFATLHPRAHLDTWARKVDNARVFCPLVDCAMVRGTPPPLKPSGVIEAGAWVVYVWALAERAPFADFDRIEALRYALSTMSIPRQPVEDGFLLPGTVWGTEQTTKTQRAEYYSYGSVDIPLTGQIERRTALVMFDASHRVALEELETVAPQVSKPRQLVGAIQRG